MLITMWPKFDHEPTEKVRITVSSVAMSAPEKRQTAARLREVLLAMAVSLQAGAALVAIGVLAQTCDQRRKWSPPPSFVNGTKVVPPVPVSSG
jgi:hypothetical protein